MKPLVIIGAGGFGREVLDLVEQINTQSLAWHVLGFLDEFQPVGTIINDQPVLGAPSWLHDHKDVWAVCGIGSPDIRRRITSSLEAAGVCFATLIHPNAVLTRWVSIEAGTIITAGCILTNQIALGKHVQINLDCTIGHNATLEDYVTLAPGVHVSGAVHMHEGVYIGTGANIIQQKTIGEWSVIGAGATVVKDIPANVTAVGSPAKVIKEHPVGWHLQKSVH